MSLPLICHSRGFIWWVQMIESGSRCGWFSCRYVLFVPNLASSSGNLSTSHKYITDHVKILVCPFMSRMLLSFDKATWIGDEKAILLIKTFKIGLQMSTQYHHCCNNGKVVVGKFHWPVRTPSLLFGSLFQKHFQMLTEHSNQQICLDFQIIGDICCWIHMHFIVSLIQLKQPHCIHPPHTTAK